MINIPVDRFVHEKTKLFFLRFLWDNKSIIKNTAIFNVNVPPQPKNRCKAYIYATFSSLIWKCNCIKNNYMII